MTSATHPSEVPARAEMVSLASDSSKLRLLFTRPSAIFLIIASFFGLVFIAIIPPGYNPDEPSHFFRTIEIAQGGIFPHQIPHDDFSDMTMAPPQTVGGMIPRSAGELFAASNVFPTDKGPMGGPEKVGVINWSALFSIPTQSEKISIGTTAGAYSPIGYIPAIIPYWAGDFLDLPIAVTFYLARFFTLITGIVLTWAAIKLIPRGKWILLMVGILPTTIIQFGAIGTDSLILGSSFLIVALIFRAAFQDGNIRWAQLVQFSLVFSAVGLLKPNYLTLVGLLVAIPLCNKKARRFRTILLLILAVIIAATLAVLWQRVAGLLPPSFSSIENSQAQRAFIRSDPLSFLKTLFYTFFTDLGPQRWYLPQIFGSAVWARVSLATPFIYLSCGALAFSTLVPSPAESDWEGPRPTRLILSLGEIFLFAISSAAVAYGLYTSFSAPKLTGVTGLQGRYFVPLLPLCLLSLMPIHIKTLEIQHHLRCVTFSIACIALAFMTWQTWSYLWKPPLGLIWPS